MEHVSGLVLGLAAGFIGLATIAVLVAPTAQTNAIGKTLFAGIAQDTSAAVSPLSMGGGAGLGNIISAGSAFGTVSL